jgi:hypothetical protein
MKSIVKCVENWSDGSNNKGRCISYYSLLSVSVWEVLSEDYLSDKSSALVEFETPFGVLGYLFTGKRDVEKLISDVEAGGVIEIEKKKVFDSRGVFVFESDGPSSQNFNDKMLTIFLVSHGTYLSDLKGKLYDTE